MSPMKQCLYGSDETNQPSSHQHCLGNDMKSSSTSKEDHHYCYYPFQLKTLYGADIHNMQVVKLKKLYI